MLVDFADTLPQWLHLFTTLLAHMHSSINVFIYGYTNRHFKAAYYHIWYKITGQSFGFSEKDTASCKVINVACTKSSQSMKSINQVRVAEKMSGLRNVSANDKLRLMSLSSGPFGMKNGLFSKMQPRPPLITDHFPPELKMPPHLANGHSYQKSGLSVVD